MVVIQLWWARCAKRVDRNAQSVKLRVQQLELAELVRRRVRQRLHCQICASDDCWNTVVPTPMWTIAARKTDTGTKTVADPNNSDRQFQRHDRPVVVIVRAADPGQQHGVFVLAWPNQHVVALDAQLDQVWIQVV